MWMVKNVQNIQECLIEKHTLSIHKHTNQSHTNWYTKTSSLMQRKKGNEAAVKSWITNYKPFPIYSIMKYIHGSRTKSLYHAEMLQSPLINRLFNFYHHLLLLWQQLNLSTFCDHANSKTLTHGTLPRYNHGHQAKSTCSLLQEAKRKCKSET